MFTARRTCTVTAFLLIAISLPLWSQSPRAANAATEDRLELHYNITLEEASGPVEVELTIQNIHQPTLDLFVTSFQDPRQGGYYPLVSDVVPKGSSGIELQVWETHAAQAMSLFDVAIRHVSVDRWRITTQGETEITITYQLPGFGEIIPHLGGPGNFFEGAYYGLYEFILLRPSRASAIIDNATIYHALPENWSVATTYEETAPGTYATSALTNMYGDNSQGYKNFAETIFFWADTSKITIDHVLADGLEFIFIATNNNLPKEIQDGYVQLNRYFSSVFGPLPIERRIEINFNEGYMFPAAHVNNHPLYGEWYSMYPGDLDYLKWEWDPQIDTKYGNPHVFLIEPTMYTGVHRFARAWIGVMLPRSLGEDGVILVNDGLINYYENRAMGNFWKPSLVHQRFADMYSYYIENWLGTRDDRPVAQKIPGGHHFGEFKATLILYLLNQRIIENSAGEQTLDDVTRLFYKRFAVLGETKYYTLEDFLQSINDTTGEDYNAFIDQYIYGIEPLPLDSYFEDPDRDGLMTGLENEIGTDPGNPDTDGDGFTDGQEVDKMGTDPNVPATPTPVPSSTPTATAISTPTVTLALTSTSSPTILPSPTPLPPTEPSSEPKLESVAIIMVVTVGVLIWLALLRRKA